MILRNFFAELKRRNVYKVAVAYAVVGWLVIQISSTILPTFHAPEWVLQTLVVLVALGFPISLVIAWAFEMTPEGLRRTENVSPDEKIPQWSQRKFAALILTIALLAGGLLGYQLIRARSSAAPTLGAALDKSIAVLPLVNESGDASQEYFSDGLTDELINGLGHIRQLRVIGRNSSFLYKGKTQDSRAIGQALGVSNLLEGSVRKAADRIRIALQLVKASDGSQLWSEVYDRQLSDVFALQQEIARAVADQLRITLVAIDVPSGSQPSNNSLDAYNAFLRGEFYLVRTSPEDLSRAVQFYDEAIRIDPAYAEAYARKAGALARIGYTRGMNGREMFEEARVAAKRALTLKPGLAFAHGVLAYIYRIADWNLAAAKAELDKSPAGDAGALNVRAIVTADGGEIDRAINLAQQAIAKDPRFVVFKTNLGAFLVRAERYDQAEATLREATEVEETSDARFLLAVLAARRGDPEAALREAQQARPGLLHDLAVAIALSAGSDRAAADRATSALDAKYRSESPFRVATAYAFRGERDRAFELLELAYAEHDPRFIALLTDPLLPALYRDPRFAGLCNKIGVPVPK